MRRSLCKLKEILKLLFLISFISINSCKSSKEKTENGKPNEDFVFKCKIAIIQKGDIYQSIEGYGTVIPYRLIEYKAPVEGIIKTKFREGDEIIPGDTLFYIENPEFEAEFKAAWLKYLSIKPYFELKDTLNPEIYEILARYERMKQIKNQMTPVAEYRGIITYLRAGERAITKGEKLAEIMLKDTVLVEGYITYKEFKRVKRDAEVLVKTIDEKYYKAKLYGISRVLNEGKIKVIIMVPDSLLPGMKVQFKLIVARKRNVLKIPKRAIVNRENRQIVFKVKNGKAIWTEIKTGFIGDEFVELLKGALKEGDTVIVEGQDFIAHGSKIKIVKND